MSKLKVDKVDLIGKLLYIDDKEGNVVPLKFNYVQRQFHHNKGRRNIILKARQEGVTSSILADMHTDCIFIPHTSCAVTSHETRATQRLLDRVHFYHDTMDPPKPPKGADSRSEISFPDMHSSIYIGTAGSRAFGRGDTIRKALLSELSFYENAENILSGVEDAVPMTGELTIECTPNGEDNVFYYKWVQAREGKSPYKPFFFPWWIHAEYQLPEGSDIALLEDRGEIKPTGEEEELVEKFGLTIPQLRWRRYKLAEKGGIFFQEYPEDEVSCFITVGDPVFDTMVLNSLAQSCYDGQKHKQGWTYWIPPQDKMRYVIGADTSAGSPTGSYSAAVVLDTNWNVCATFQARLEPHTFAEILRELGKWYNMAEIAIERNFTGYAVLGQLQTYPNIYHQRDFISGKVTAQRGWWTNEQTKQYMMTKTKDMFPSLKVWDINLIRQLRSYRYIKHIPTAQSFNDMAIALMIAVAARAVSGGSYGYQGKIEGWSW